MFRKSTQSRQATDDFTASLKKYQEEERLLRMGYCPILGISTDHEKWIKIAAKKYSLAEEYPSIRAISNLRLFRIVDWNQDKEVPPYEVLHRARGTVIVQLPSVKPFIFRPSIPHRYEVIGQDHLIPDEEGKLHFKKFSPMRESLTVHIDDVKFRPYIDGSTYQIGLFDGQMIEMTSSNLLPGGVKAHNGKGWIHKPAAWGVTPFSESFWKIADVADPQMRNSLFPKGCRISKFTYNFIICTRERSRGYNNRNIPLDGFLIFIGASENFSYGSVGLTDQQIGVRHEKPYTPKMVTTLDFLKSEENPDEMEPFILSSDANMTLEEADAYLCGDRSVKDKRFARGGALLATVSEETFTGDVVETVVHIKSTGYLHRSLISGADQKNTYHQFMSLLKYTDYPLTPVNINLLDRYFPPLALPNPQRMINTPKGNVNIATRIKEGLDIPVVFEKENWNRLRENRIMTVLWHLIHATNPTKRLEVWSYGAKLNQDTDLVVSWIKTYTKDTPIRETDLTNAKYRNIRNVITKTKKDMVTTSNKFTEGNNMTVEQAYRQFFVSQGELASKIVKYCKNSRDEARPMSVPLSKKTQNKGPLDVATEEEEESVKVVRNTRAKKTNQDKDTKKEEIKDALSSDVIPAAEVPLSILNEDDNEILETDENVEEDASGVPVEKVTNPAKRLDHYKEVLEGSMTSKGVRK